MRLLRFLLYIVLYQNHFRFCMNECIDYLGCYRDVQKPLSCNTAPNEYFIVSSTISCIEECNNNGYPFAAYKHGKLCTCAIEVPQEFNKVPESECNDPFTESGKNCSCDFNMVFTTGISGAVYDTSLIYVGCYEDGPLWRKLKGFGISDSKMTPKVCVDICEHKGFLHAGVQNRDQCYCGNNTLLPEDKRPESECDSVCKGNETLICGGSWRNSVYNTSHIVSVPDVGTSLHYMGCYVDSFARKLTGYKTINDKMTPEVCVDICKSKGFLYAGVQHGDQCYCGDNRLHPEDKRPDSECNSVCKGNKTFICGGPWKNSVYETSDDIVPGVDSSLNYMGCYTDRFLFQKRLKENSYNTSDSNMTPHICVDICENKGFLYAGVQNGDQCFCGNDIPQPNDKRPESECDSVCKGNKIFICGASQRKSVYNTSFVVTMPNIDTSLDYVGCYEYGHHRKLNGYSKSDSNMTPKSCTDICKTEEFLFAGLNNGDQCFCGNDDPQLQDQHAESKCSSVCNGNKTFICGSFWLYSVYKTSHIETVPDIDTSLAYKGCFENKRVWSKFGVSLPSLTPKSCVDICKSKGFKYAGIQLGHWCSCGNAAFSPLLIRPESECNRVCNGNKTLICGGVLTNSVYQTQYTETMPNIDTSLAYKGCLKDKHLSNKFEGSTASLPNMTPKTCVDICKSKGFKYAGIRNGHRCSCGNADLSLLHIRPESECNKVCSGNKTLICGGVFRKSVYETLYTGPTVDKNLDYQGCYVDTKEGNLRGYYIDTIPMVPEKCVNICRQEEYLFAGVQYGNQCFCGNMMPHPRDRAPESDCNIACIGNPTYLCGGYFRNSVYKT